MFHNLSTATFISLSRFSFSTRFFTAAFGASCLHQRLAQAFDTTFLSLSRFSFSSRLPSTSFRPPPHYSHLYHSLFCPAVSSRRATRTITLAAGAPTHFCSTCTVGKPTCGADTLRGRLHKSAQALDPHTFLPKFPGDGVHFFADFAPSDFIIFHRFSPLVYSIFVTFSSVSPNPIWTCVHIFVYIRPPGENG